MEDVLSSCCRCCVLRFKGVQKVQSYQAAVNDEAEASPTGGAVCPCCLGVLQLVTEYADNIAAEIQRQAFDASTFNLSVLLPAPLYVRQWGFWHLLVQSNAVGSDSAATGEGVIDCKEVLKWLLPTLLEQRLAAKYTTKSDVMLTLSYTAQHLFAEAEFLGQMDKKVSAKRSRSRKGGKLTRGEPEIPPRPWRGCCPGSPTPTLWPSLACLRRRPRRPRGSRCCV